MQLWSLDEDEDVDVDDDIKPRVMVATNKRVRPVLWPGKWFLPDQFSSNSQSHRLHPSQIFARRPLEFKIAVAAVAGWLAS